MDRVPEHHRVAGSARRRRSREAGFTLAELVVTLAVTGFFMLTIGTVLIRSLGFARVQQARTDARVASRYGLDIVAAEVAETSARIPPQAAYRAGDTHNNVTDESVADPGTDTLCTLRSRTGVLSRILDVTGSSTSGSMRLRYHVTDDTGPDAICATTSACEAAFTADFGEPGGFLLVYSETNDFWLLRITGTPGATLGLGGGVDVAYQKVYDSGSGLDFRVGDLVTGVEARTFRVMDERLEMKEGFFASAGDFMVLSDGVEDMQLAYLMSDGTYVNTGLPGQLANIRATAVSLVAVAPPDMSVGGVGFTRPEVEDHAAGDVPDRRRRSVLREIVWGRNLSLDRE